MKWKTLILVLSLVFGITTLNAQESKKQAKADKKAAKEQKARDSKAKLVELVKNKEWVIEAFSVSTPGSSEYSVSPDINFVAVVGDGGLVQLSFNSLQGMGINGLGGFTMEGTVEKYDFDEGKDLRSFTLIVRVNSRQSGWVLLNISVQADGRASVNVTGSYGGQFTFSGNMKSLEESGAYKGFVP